MSHHLRVLREAGIVRTEPCGSFTYYILEREVLGALGAGIAELANQPRGGVTRRPCS